MKNLLNELVLNTDLLSNDLKAAILANSTPPIEEIVMALVIGAVDAHAMTVGDPKATWNEKRLARTTLATAFLAAMTVTNQREGSGGR